MEFSRRDFIKTAGVAAAGAFIPNSPLKASGTA
ncbi:MAG: twin-arginine translocation signal domain-containing protein, partial [Tannerella sp.]|nr:twin-arginine translocation signal domain-containing protein [Tannerella sp.]MDR2120865.1 twin-arginine translocation signal domain-containing protein [Tannerella sp.]